MIDFTQFKLKNGLRVILHQDKTTPIAAVNLLYGVGARNEQPDKTGFAHLFEHLMFGGSVNIPDYDNVLQMVGGDNNAFTNNDITNYYLTLPKENIETAFWLESDRMLALDFDERKLQIQRNVVIEEYKQRYLNRPYGDAMLLLRPLAFRNHPYRWPTIGKDISHIRQATLDDVKHFYYTHYAPNNAILSVAGDISFDNVRQLIDKWFGQINARQLPDSNIVEELPQNEERKLTVERNVPYNAIYKAYKMGNRLDKDYQGTDLLSDILANGKSSRLYQQLVKKHKIFGTIDAYILGSIDNGLFIINGYVMEEIDIETAESAIEHEIEKIKNEPVSEYELNKVANKVEATLEFSEMSCLTKAMNLAFCELLGDANDINNEIHKYRRVKCADIKRIAANILRKDNCSTLYYLSRKKEK